MVRWMSVAVVVLLVAASVLIDGGALLAVPLLFVLIVPFERWFPRHAGQRLRRPGLGTDLAYALAAPALGAIGIAVAIVVGLISFAWVPGLVVRPVVSALPAVVVPIVGVVLFDLAVYVVHRLSHELPLLWRFHSVHHSTRTLDWVSGFRNHPVDGAIIAPPFVLLVAAGFSPGFTGVLAIVQGIAGLFLHANVRWRLRPLQRIVITPEFHHWHHADEVDAHGTNYAGLLPLWDLVFGTYRVPADRRPQVYGISTAMPDGVVAQLRQPFRTRRTS